MGDCGARRAPAGFLAASVGHLHCLRVIPPSLPLTFLLGRMVLSHIPQGPLCQGPFKRPLLLGPSCSHRTSCQLSSGSYGTVV